jgi:hypothetical protein
MSDTQVLERIASEAQLDRDDVEKVLEAAFESISEAAEHGEVVGGFRSGKLAAFAILMAALPDEQSAGLDATTATLLRHVRNVVAHGGRADELVAQLMPANLELPTPATVLQARRNAEARLALLHEFGALRSHEVAELAGSRAANRAALANRWRGEGRVLAVALGDELLYPGFQFTAEGRPHPAVAEALGRLRSDPGVTDWQAALWFASPTGWLGGQRPVDLIDEDPDAVIEAAAQEAADIAG